jgi:hypothetical protein
MIAVEYFGGNNADNPKMVPNRIEEAIPVSTVPTNVKYIAVCALSIIGKKGITISVNRSTTKDSTILDPKEKRGIIKIDRSIDTQPDQLYTSARKNMNEGKKWYSFAK